jgi:hypothetical protein
MKFVSKAGDLCSGRGAFAVASGQVESGTNSLAVLNWSGSDLDTFGGRCRPSQEGLY